jgi:uncharacterized protein (DUF2236 family)
MPFHIDPMRLIGWLSGATLPRDLPINDTTPDPGLMGPESVTWKLHREQWLILGGGQAFLMQAAHPQVAQGAIDFSAYAEDPFGRVYRTVMAMTVFLTGTHNEANEAARRINRIHHTVKGTLHETIGRYHAGDPYDAMDVNELLWVHIVFVDSMINAYTTFVGPLTPAERDAYWQESWRYARLLGLADSDLPPDYLAMRRYITDAIATGEVAVGDASRTVARTILYPPLPWYRNLTWGLVRLIGGGLLPPGIRAGYGLQWGRWRRAGFWLLRYSCRITRFLLPGVLGRSYVIDFANRRVQSDALPALGK